MENFANHLDEFEQRNWINSVNQYQLPDLNVTGGLSAVAALIDLSCVITAFIALGRFPVFLLQRLFPLHLRDRIVDVMGVPFMRSVLAERAQSSAALTESTSANDPSRHTHFPKMSVEQIEKVTLCPAVATISPESFEME